MCHYNTQQKNHTSLICKTAFFNFRIIFNNLLQQDNTYPLNKKNKFHTYIDLLRKKKLSDLIVLLVA